MVNRDLLLLVDSISNEKNMDKESIFKAIETALGVVASKYYGDKSCLHVYVNRETGDYKVFRHWTVVDNSSKEPADFDADKHLTLKNARKINKKLNVGDVLEEPIDEPNLDFGRIAAQKAKYIILREIKNLGKNELEKKYKEKIGSLFAGTVSRLYRDKMLLDIKSQTTNESEDVEYILDECLPREFCHSGDKIKAVLREVDRTRSGVVLYLSRTNTEMLKALLRLEVPEINEDIIQIKAIARDPGVRAKVAVKTNDGRIDPVGACIGIKGSRVQAISNELCGEKIDIVLWNEDLAQFVINAMSPVEISSIVIDEENNSVDVIVEDRHLAKAIGKNGQNVKLASDLAKCKINVLSTSEVERKDERENSAVLHKFTKFLDIDNLVAEILIKEGFKNFENLSGADIEDIASIEGFDDEIAKKIKERAKEALLEEILSDDQVVSDNVDIEKISKDNLLSISAMTKQIACVLQNNGIKNTSDLADQSVDELVDIGIEKELAADLIMEARKDWVK